MNDDLKSTPLDRILIIDTETTGLSEDAEVIQFAAVWADGFIADNLFIRPSHTKEWPEAMKINHISPEDLKDCPTMPEVLGRINKTVQHAQAIVGYNVNFDLIRLHRNGVNYRPGTLFVDLMAPFAKVYGQYDEEKKRYKYQKLSTCAKYYGYKGTQWHNAMDDVKATFYCLAHMIDTVNIVSP